MCMDIVKPYCETIARKVTPAIRALIAIKLSQKYKLTETEVARKLGLTQPAVSYYLRSKRGFGLVKRLENDAKINGLLDMLAEMIYKNEDTDKIRKTLCEICTEIRDRGMV